MTTLCGYFLGMVVGLFLGSLWTLMIAAVTQSFMEDGNDVADPN